MTIATAFVGIDMESAFVWYGTPTIVTTSQIRIQSGYYTQDYFGNFTYDYNGLTGGTVTSSYFYYSGVKYYSLTGGSFSAITVNNYINANNPIGLLNYIFSGNDTLNGSPYGDSLKEYSGADVMSGGGGNDTIDGGSGADTVVYATTYNSATVTKNPNGSVTITTLAEGTDVLTNIEFLRFADQTISVLNTAPIITSITTASAAENVSPATSVYIASATDPDANTTLTYSISGGADAALFNINTSTGAITFKASPDYEAPTDAGANNVYDITVRASDGSLYADKAVVINVTDVNEASNIAGTVGNDTIAGTSGSDTINGFAGNDVINGGAGDDFIYGGLGDDSLFGGQGDDFLDGDANTNLSTVTASRALRFDGVDDYVEIFDSESLDITGSLTIELWVNFVGFTSETWPALVVKSWSHPSENASYWLNFSNHSGDRPDSPYFFGAAKATTGAHGFLTGSSTQFRDGEWHHLAGVIDDVGGMVRFYIDGALAAEGQRTGGIKTNNFSLYLGNHPGHDPRLFSGAIDEVRVWNIARSQTEIVAAKDTEIDGGSSGLVGYWKFNEVSGALAVDSSLAGNNGIIYGSPERITSGPLLSQTGTVGQTHSGGGGDDQLTGGIGNDTVDGGYGIDTATYASTFNSSTITKNFNGSVTVTNASEGTDTLTNIEFLRFSDQTISLSNKVPSLTSTIFATTPENVPTTTTVYTATATGSDANTIISYSLSGGADAALFNINAFTGAVTFKASPNFEAPADAGANNVYDIIVRASAGSLFDDKAVAITVTNHAEEGKSGRDFNGDGKSDVLLQNVNDGSCYVWELNGASLVGNGFVGWTPGAVWQAKSTGDFNGDGKSDILLQNANDGGCYVWELNGASLVGAGYVGWTPGTAWQAKATGDFNGDGKSDILLQNATDGSCYVWELDGASLVGNGYVGWTPGATWQAKGTGDFNGDGKSDVLLQNVNDGSCYIWELDGTGLVGNGYVGWTPGKDWQAKGTGDFNGDGKSDILLQNMNDGSCYIWELNGTSLIGNGYVGWAPGKDWQAKGTGDFNGDGKSDILLQNSNDGSCYIWELNGTSLVGNGHVGWTPGVDWQAAA